MKSVPHIIKEGSREHVIYYDCEGRHCTCPECEVNYENEGSVKMNKIDWERHLKEVYRKKFGCQNIGKVCWCDVCAAISKLINEIKNYIKESI